MNNQDIRQEIKEASLKYWQVADAYGCADGTFSRKLRKELPECEKQRIRQIIADLSREAV